MAQLTRHRGGIDLLSRLHNDFDRLLSSFDFRTDYHWPEVSTTDWIPNVDVRENDKCYMIRADLPGVKPSDIDVNIENGLLTIKGSRESEIKEEKENYLRVERSTGSFMRQIMLPQAVEKDKIQAICKEGVLEITLPKAKETLGRKIEIKVK